MCQDLVLFTFLTKSELKKKWVERRHCGIVTQLLFSWPLDCKECVRKFERLNKSFVGLTAFEMSAVSRVKSLPVDSTIQQPNYSPQQPALHHVLLLIHHPQAWFISITVQVLQTCRPFSRVSNTCPYCKKIHFWPLFGSSLGMTFCYEELWKDSALSSKDSRHKRKVQLCCKNTNTTPVFQKI